VVREILDAPRRGPKDLWARSRTRAPRTSCLTATAFPAAVSNGPCSRWRR